MRSPFITLPLLLAMSTAVAAHSNHSHHNHSHGHDHGHEHHHDHGALGAHVHGMAQLDVVLEGKLLMASLESPAADLVGFEHKARDEESIAAVKAMESALRDPATLWLLPEAAQCTLDTVDVRHSLLEKHAGHEHDHKHDHKHDHDHDHDHDHSDDHAHSDVEVDYSFTCQQPERLDQLNVQLFKHYPTLEQIQVQLISPKGQQAATLTSASHRITLD